MLNLDILKSSDQLFSGSVFSVSVPGLGGVETILPHHQAMQLALKPGEIIFTDKENTQKKISCHSGFVQITNNHCKIVLD